MVFFGFFYTCYDVAVSGSWVAQILSSEISLIHPLIESVLNKEENRK